MNLAWYSKKLTEAFEGICVITMTALLKIEKIVIEIVTNEGIAAIITDILTILTKNGRENEEERGKGTMVDVTKTNKMTVYEEGKTMIGMGTGIMTIGRKKGKGGETEGIEITLREKENVTSQNLSQNDNLGLVEMKNN